jgi:hypothetical protein
MKLATIDDPELIAEIIAGDGYYMDDPRVYMIVEYTNAYDKITWGVTWCNESIGGRKRYLDETEYVRNPKVIWHSEG